MDKGILFRLCFTHEAYQPCHNLQLIVPLTTPLLKRRRTSYASNAVAKAEDQPQLERVGKIATMHDEGEDAPQ